MLACANPDEAEPCEEAEERPQQQQFFTTPDQPLPCNQPSQKPGQYYNLSVNNDETPYANCQGIQAQGLQVMESIQDSFPSFCCNGPEAIQDALVACTPSALQRRDSEGSCKAGPSEPIPNTPLNQQTPLSLNTQPPRQSFFVDISPIAEREKKRCEAANNVNPKLDMNNIMQVGLLAVAGFAAAKLFVE